MVVVGTPADLGKKRRKQTKSNGLRVKKMRISDGSSFRQNIGTVQEGDLIKIEQRGKRRVKAMRFPSSDTLQRRKRLTIKEASLAQSETKAILTTVSSNYNFTSSISSYPNSSKPSKDYTKSSYFGTQVFTYEELEVATYNFNDSREVGDRGFGTVYYGKLIDGREVAVKRLYENNFNRVERFLNEVEILTRLEHENLVKLYGCTSKRSNELILVYEYIPNGTVADHLHGKLANSSSSIFSWSVRLNIAIETAEALAYLHKSKIIHRDVKTNNIY